MAALEAPRPQGIPDTTGRPAARPPGSRSRRLGTDQGRKESPLRSGKIPGRRGGDWGPGTEGRGAGRGAAGTRVSGARDGDPGQEGRSETGTGGGAGREGRSGTEDGGARREGRREPGSRSGGAWQGPERDRAAGTGTGGLAGGNPESRRTGARRAARPGDPAAPARRGTARGPHRPCTPPPAGERAAPPPLGPAPPDLSSLAVITPSSLGMSSAAVTASWCPSILLSSTGRLLCGLEWISAAMFARRRRPRGGRPIS